MGKMKSWAAVLILIASVFVANLPAVVQQWRSDRPGFIETLWLMGAYALYIALGLVLFFLLVPREGTNAGKALLLTGVIVGWILYGALTLTRMVPRYREPPAWLRRVGIADVVLLGLTFGSLAVFLLT